MNIDIPVTLSRIQEFDQDKKGYLNHQDLVIATIGFFGLKPSKIMLASMFPDVYTFSSVSMKFEKPPTIELSYADVQQVFARKQREKDPDDILRTVFRHLDLEHRGFVTLANLTVLMRECFRHLPLLTIEQIFHHADQNRDGRIGFREFCKLIRQYDHDSYINIKNN